MQLPCPNIKAFAAILVFSMLALPASVFALPVNSDAASLARYEQILFGQATAGPVSVERVNALETTLYGKPHKGTIDQRLDAIGKMLEPEGAEHSTPVAEPPHPERSAHAADSSLMKGHVSLVNQQQNNAKSLMDQGMKEFQSGNRQEASGLFRQVTTLDAKNADAWFNLGVLSEQAGNDNGALTNYRAALALSPSDKEFQAAAQAMESKLGIIQANAQESPSSRLNAQHAQQPTLTGHAVTQTADPSVSRKHSGASMAKVVGTCAAVGLSVAGNLQHLDIGCPICRLLRLEH